MNPRDCGTCRPPAEDSREREEIDRFAEFLRLTKERGVLAMLADPQWRAYALGEEETSG